MWSVHWGEVFLLECVENGPNIIGLLQEKISCGLIQLTNNEM